MNQITLLVPLSDCCKSAIGLEEGKLVCGTCHGEIAEIRNQKLGLITMLRPIPEYLLGITEEEYVRLCMEPTQEDNKTICGVLKMIRTRAQDEESQQLLDLATVYAKKMDKKLREYHDKEVET